MEDTKAKGPSGFSVPTRVRQIAPRSLKKLPESLRKRSLATPPAQCYEKESKGSFSG
jgi:hypothetical protein